MKTTIKLYSIIGMAAIGLLIGFVTINVLTPLQSNASLEEDIKSHFDEKAIQYNFITTEKDVLIVDLQSEGRDRCTLEDVKAVSHIHSIIIEHYKNEPLKRVQIRIFDVNGNIIYNATEAIDTQEYNAIERLNEAYKEELISLSEDPKVAAESICKKYKIAIKDIIVGDASMSIKLESKKMGGLTDDIMAIYGDIQAYGWVRGNLSDCTIEIQDINGDIILYLTGKLNSESISIWVSPQMEDDFIQSEGPKYVE